MSGVYSAFICFVIIIGILYTCIVYFTSGDFLWKIKFLAEPIDPVVDPSPTNSGYGNPRTFELFCIKFYMTMASHFHICPWFDRSLTIMKYVSNHPNQFDMPWLAFSIGLFEFLLLPIYLVVNSLGFMHRENPHFVIWTYLSVAILADFPALYYQAMVREPNSIQQVVFNPENAPRVKWFNCDHQFSERSCPNKC